MDVKKQLEQELDHMAESFQKLRQAQNKFSDCIDTVKKSSKAQNEDKSMLVPLTSSLYIPGKMTDVTTFMVDIGTGYYVEKQADDAIKFFDNKVNTLTKNLTELEKVVNNKTSNLRSIEDTLKQRYAEEQAKSQSKAQAA